MGLWTQPVSNLGRCFSWDFSKPFPQVPCDFSRTESTSRWKSSFSSWRIQYPFSYPALKFWGGNRCQSLNTWLIAEDFLSKWRDLPALGVLNAQLLLVVSLGTSRLQSCRRDLKQSTIDLLFYSVIATTSCWIVLLSYVHFMRWSGRLGEGGFFKKSVFRNLKNKWTCLFQGLDAQK